MPAPLARRAEDHDLDPAGVARDLPSLTFRTTRPRSLASPLAAFLPSSLITKVSRGSSPLALTMIFSPSSPVAGAVTVSFFFGVATLHARVLVNDWASGDGALTVTESWCLPGTRNSWSEPESHEAALPSARQVTVKPSAAYGAATVPPYPTPMVKVRLERVGLGRDRRQRGGQLLGGRRGRRWERAAVPRAATNGGRAIGGFHLHVERVGTRCLGQRVGPAVQAGNVRRPVELEQLTS